MTTPLVELTGPSPPSRTCPLFNAALDIAPQGSASCRCNPSALDRAGMNQARLLLLAMGGPGRHLPFAPRP